MQLKPYASYVHKNVSVEGETVNEICPICHSGFYLRPSRRKELDKKGKPACCSRACFAELKILRMMRHCPQCNRYFHARTGQIYCSRSCSASAVHERNGNTIGNATDLKECPVCHTKYEKGHGAYTNDAYCSIRCHAMARDARRPLSQRKLTPDPFTYDIPRDPVRAVNPNLGY